MPTKTKPRHQVLVTADIGASRDGKQDQIQLILSYRMGPGPRGYHLHGNVSRVDNDGTMRYLLFSGIREDKLIERAGRFSHKRLLKIGRDLVADKANPAGELPVMFNSMRAELDRRIAAGEDY